MRTTTTHSWRLIAVACLWPLWVGTTSAESGPTYRVGYLESHVYWSYTETFNALEKQLSNLGWGDRIEFPENACFSPGKKNKEELIQRASQLMAREDLDAVLAVGTRANRAILSVNNSKLPIFGMNVSDAVKSGFVPNEEDSGASNYTVRIVPNRYKRMFRFFHDEVGFKKLGMMYENEKNKNNNTNLDDAEAVAAERGFELVAFDLDRHGESDTYQGCQRGIETLIEKGIDAFFIPAMVCFDKHFKNEDSGRHSDVEKLMKTLSDAKIETFARQGTPDVKAGALMGFSSYDFDARASVLAKRLIAVLEGKPARAIPMVDNAPPKIILNLATAELIDFDPTFSILIAADELYLEWATPEKPETNAEAEVSTEETRSRCEPARNPVTDLSS